MKFLLHFLFLVTAIALLSRRGVRFYWPRSRPSAAGIFLNACYGVVQLLAELTGATSTRPC